MMTINCALLDENNKIINLLVFENEDLELATQVKNLLSANDFKFSNDDSVILGGYYLNNMFYPIKPYESWIPDDNEPVWIPPVAMPDSGFWSWNEETLSWVEGNL